MLPESLGKSNQMRVDAQELRGSADAELHTIARKDEGRPAETVATKVNVDADAAMQGEFTARQEEQHPEDAVCHVEVNKAQVAIPTPLRMVTQSAHPNNPNN